MVPITLFSFLCAGLTMGANLGHHVTVQLSPNIPIQDILSLLLVGVGVFLYNFYEEKPQKTMIEHVD